MRKLIRLVSHLARDFVLFWDMRALLASIEIRHAARPRVGRGGFPGVGK